MDDLTNTVGPAGSHGCNCVSDSALNCLLLREGYRGAEECQCFCHRWRNEEPEVIEHG